MARRHRPFTDPEARRSRWIRERTATTHGVAHGAAHRIAFIAAVVLAPGILLESTPAEAQQRQRGICRVDILQIDLHQQDCGRRNQIVCDSGAACDSGFRALSFAAAGEPNVVLDCSILPDETITRVCTPYGSEEELGNGAD